MAPPTPPIPPGPPARDREREPQPDRRLPRPSSPVSDVGQADVGMVGGHHARDEAMTRSGLASDEAERLPLAEVPFAWQHGRRLLLLDEEARGWTFAELRFDDLDCRYVEIRRATFRWPREAAGALLARGVAFGVEPAERLAGALDRWLALHLASASEKKVDA